MALTIETQGNAVLFNGVLTGKEGWVISQSSTRDNISISNKITGIGGSAPVDEVEVDGSTYSDFDALVAALGTVLFKTGGGTGEGVQTVNGQPGPDVVLDASDVGAVASQQEEGVGTVITNMVAMTQAEYDGLTSPQASTYYVITD